MASVVVSGIRKAGAFDIFGGIGPGSPAINSLVIESGAATTRGAGAGRKLNGQRGVTSLVRGNNNSAAKVVAQMRWRRAAEVRRASR